MPFPDGDRHVCCLRDLAARLAQLGSWIIGVDGIAHYSVNHYSSLPTVLIEIIGLSKALFFELLQKSAIDKLLRIRLGCLGLALSECVDDRLHRY